MSDSATCPLHDDLHDDVREIKGDVKEMSRYLRTYGLGRAFATGLGFGTPVAAALAAVAKVLWG